MAKRAPGRYPEGKASPKPVFAAFLVQQGNRPDIVGDLAREAQAKQFEGSAISDLWEDLERLDVDEPALLGPKRNRNTTCWCLAGRSAGRRAFMRDVLTSAACRADDADHRPCKELGGFKSRQLIKKSVLENSKVRHFGRT